MRTERKNMIYAVDFDGTLCTSCWPDIGAPNIILIDWLKRQREKGEKLILWTCREGELLRAAVEWCEWMGLKFDAVNENLPENIEYYGSDCRKVHADIYIDDKSLQLETVNRMIGILERKKK